MIFLRVYVNFSSVLEFSYSEDKFVVAWKNAFFLSLWNIIIISLILYIMKIYRIWN